MYHLLLHFLYSLQVGVLELSFWICIDWPIYLAFNNVIPYAPADNLVPEYNIDILVALDNLSRGPKVVGVNASYLLTRIITIPEPPWRLVLPVPGWLPPNPPAPPPVLGIPIVGDLR